MLLNKRFLYLKIYKLEGVIMLSSFIYLVLMVFEELGYWGIMFGFMIEIILSEIVFVYVGYLVFNGSILFIGVVVFGIIGGVIV